MRTLTANLIAAHAVRSPKYDVSLSVSARGTNPDMPALSWAKLSHPVSVKPNFPSAGFDTTAGYIVRFRGAVGGIYQQTITNPTVAAQWTGNAWTNINANMPSALAAYRHAATSARIYYINGGNVYYLRTTDDGASWLARLTLYSGGDAAVDVTVTRTPAGHSLNANVVGFTTYNAGVYAAYFNAGINRKYADYWRAAGVFTKADDTTYVYPLVFRQSSYGPARLRVLRFDGATFDQPVDIDQTQSGLFGLNLCAYKFCGIPDSNLLIGSAVESGYTGQNYEGIASGFWQDELLADEPILFPEIQTWNSKSYAHIVRSGNDYYYFTEKAVWRGQAQAATTDTLYPISYEYNQGLRSNEPSGTITIKLPQDTPDIYASQLLTLRRTVSWGTLTGYEDLAFTVVATMRSKQNYIVTAVDPIGLMGIARCRRPDILNDGSAAGVATVLRRLAARFGIPAARDDAGLETDAVMPITLAPSESLLGAAYRITSQSDVYLIPAGDGTFRAEMINPPTSVSGDHDDTAHTYPSEQWNLIDAQAISEYNRLAFAYVLGTYSTDPEDGSYVGMAAGPALPNTRPLSYSLTNTRYNTDTRVLAAATREASRQQKLTIDAVIEAPVNLALELYDIVSVTEPLLSWSAKSFRVRRIKEVWNKHLLTQTLYLGDES